jgi:hypothetical protein
MPRSKIVIAMIGAVAAGPLCGCGGPPGAGTVDMAAIKAAAARRGIPEAKTTVAAGSAAGERPDRARPTTPAQPIPKGWRR